MLSTWVLTALSTTQEHRRTKIIIVIIWSVSWCFKPSQTQRIISGLRETFIKRFIVERTNKAEIKPEEQSEKAYNCRENLRGKYGVAVCNVIAKRYAINTVCTINVGYYEDSNDDDDDES